MLLAVFANTVGLEKHAASIAASKPTCLWAGLSHAPLEHSALANPLPLNIRSREKTPIIDFRAKVRLVTGPRAVLKEI
jgi:hypothetical protein